MLTGCNTNTPSTTDPSSNPPATSTPTAESPAVPNNVGEYDFSSDKTFNLAFALYLPDGNSAFDWINPLVDGIREGTDGTVNIEVYAGGTLAAGDETADAIKSGVADMGLWPSAYALGTFPFCYMLEYPGIEYGSAKAASYAFTEWLDTLQPAEIQDYKLMFSYCSGPGMFLMANSPIRTVNDFAGKQIRTNAVNALAVAAYGGTPVTLAVSEVYEAMRTGVIDGYSGITESLISFKFNEVTKYATYNPFFQSAYVMIMNKDVWNSMSEGQQKVVDEVSRRVWEEVASSYLERDYAEKAIQILRDSGVELIKLSDEDLAMMLDMTKGITPEYAASLDAKGLNGTAAYELLVELVAKYNAIYPTNG